GQSGDRPLQVLRLRVALLRDLSQTRSPEQGQVDVRRQRHEALVRADVGRRLLAPDVLLARRERQAEGAAALRVASLADEATRDLTLVLGPAREEAEERPAVVHRHAERLGLAARD